jgi:hypothetical protein
MGAAVVKLPADDGAMGFILAALATAFVLWRFLSGRWKTREVRPKAANIDDPDTRTAVHEVGHLLVAARCTRVDAIIGAEIRDDGGSVTYDIRSDDGKVECEMVILLAGLAAENMVYGMFHPSECRDDLMRARVLAKHAIARRFPYSSDNLPKFFGKVFEVPASEKENGAMQLAYVTARTLLEKKNALAHSKLVGSLLAMRKMSERDIEAHVGGRGFIKALCHTRRLFL